MMLDEISWSPYHFLLPLYRFPLLEMLVAFGSSSNHHGLMIPLLL